MGGKKPSSGGGAAPGGGGRGLESIIERLAESLAKLVLAKVEGAASEVGAKVRKGRKGSATGTTAGNAPDSPKELQEAAADQSDKHRELYKDIRTQTKTLPEVQDKLRESIRAATKAEKAPRRDEVANRLREDSFFKKARARGLVTGPTAVEEDYEKPAPKLSRRKRNRFILGALQGAGFGEYYPEGNFKDIAMQAGGRLAGGALAATTRVAGNLAMTPFNGFQGLINAAHATPYVGAPIAGLLTQIQSAGGAATGFLQNTMEAQTLFGRLGGTKEDLQKQLEAAVHKARTEPLSYKAPHVEKVLGHGLMGGAIIQRRDMNGEELVSYDRDLREKNAAKAVNAIGVARTKSTNTSFMHTNFIAAGENLGYSAQESLGIASRYGMSGGVAQAGDASRLGGADMSQVLAASRRGVSVEALGLLARNSRPYGGASTGSAESSAIVDAIAAGFKQGLEETDIPKSVETIASLSSQAAKQGSVYKAGGAAGALLGGTSQGRAAIETGLSNTLMSLGVAGGTPVENASQYRAMLAVAGVKNGQMTMADYVRYNNRRNTPGGRADIIKDIMDRRAQMTDESRDVWAAGELANIAGTQVDIKMFRHRMTNKPMTEKESRAAADKFLKVNTAASLTETKKLTDKEVGVGLDNLPSIQKFMTAQLEVLGTSSKTFGGVLDTASEHVKELADATAYAIKKMGEFITTKEVKMSKDEDNTLQSH